MSRREGQLFVGRLSKTTRTRDLEEIFELYGRLIRCDVKYGVEVAYAFVDFEDYRDAEDCIKYENGRNVCGSSIIVEWAKGSPRRPLVGGQSYDECYRCHRSGHWARDCPDDRWGGGGGGSFRSGRTFRSPPRRRRSYSRSRSRERRRRSRSRSRDRRRRSRSRDRRSRSRSKSHERRSSRRKSHDRKDSKSRDRDRKSGSKSRSRSRSKSKAHSRSKSRSRSPEQQNGNDGDGGDTGQQDEGGASPARSRSGSAN